MRTLELPITIRTLREDELSPTEKNADWLEKIKVAKITEGYVLHETQTDELQFKFFAEVNVDNSKLWEVFKALLLSFDEEISLIFGHVDQEPFYGSYLDKFEILNYIEKFQTELTQDGFLEFGIIYNDEEKLKEVFIKRPKYIQFWGTDKDEFQNIMSSFSIYETEDIKFIDEFPMVTKSLKTLSDKAIDTVEIINSLKDRFIGT